MISLMSAWNLNHQGHSVLLFSRRIGNLQRWFTSKEFCTLDGALIMTQQPNFKMQKKRLKSSVNFELKLISPLGRIQLYQIRIRMKVGFPGNTILRHVKMNIKTQINPTSKSRSKGKRLEKIWLSALQSFPKLLPWLEQMLPFPPWMEDPPPTTLNTVLNCNLGYLLPTYESLWKDSTLLAMKYLGILKCCNLTTMPSRTSQLEEGKLYEMVVFATGFKEFEFSRIFCHLILTFPHFFYIIENSI